MRRLWLKSESMHCRMDIAGLLHNTICRYVVNGDPGDLVVLLWVTLSVPSIYGRKYAVLTFIFGQTFLV